MVLPKKVFFTRGVGKHKDQLVSFEMALRDAKIAPFNLVYVSSIMPPDADIVPREEGLKYLRQGEVVYCVMARNSCNEPGRMIASAIGLAVPQIHDRHHGYLSEQHCLDQTAEECGAYAEELANVMLQTIMEDQSKIVKTEHISVDAVCEKDMWTTTIAAAVFVC
ncbi:MAG TPA: arginine decarboxylase, pyruvoyl-dependent [Methanocorpusculum sp.]|nr:arginine decarboxylase, pyruvoyl-dependent [Methanocorpusculum sp.]